MLACPVCGKRTKGLTCMILSCETKCFCWAFFPYKWPRCGGQRSENGERRWYTSRTDSRNPQIEMACTSSRWGRVWVTVRVEVNCLFIRDPIITPPTVVCLSKRTVSIGMEITGKLLLSFVQYPRDHWVKPGKRALML